MARTGGHLGNVGLVGSKAKVKDMSTDVVDVVIVGGGVGGLAVAWNLYQPAITNGTPPPSIALLEASDRFGGNADTVNFTFGSGPGSQKIDRWADLGVNDFNTVAYTKIVSVMKKIGFVEGKNYKPLEDSTSYYTGDGSLYFTDNKNPWWGTQIDPALGDSVTSFMTIAGQDAAAGKFATYTIEQYIKEQTLQQNPAWDPRLGPQVVYPRINGMYFVSELGPRGMPFLAVMHYYAMQEGAGGLPPRRRYFVRGASTWIDALVDYMKAQMPSVEFMTCYKASINQFNAVDRKFRVIDSNGKGAPIEADKIVLAAHADDSLIAFTGGLPDIASSTMANIRYNNGISVAHTDSRVLPVNRNAWCTYNIVIHEPESAALKPYVINYVANRHQNDAANPEYNKFGLPEFFVSVNPQRPIPENMILKNAKGELAMANLRHNNFDFATMEAQRVIDSVQGMNDVYFAGGWTSGSGLHEECWGQGEHVAKLILSHSATGSPKAQGEIADTGKFIGERLCRNLASED